MLEIIGTIILVIALVIGIGLEYAFWEITVFIIALVIGTIYLLIWQNKH